MKRLIAIILLFLGTQMWLHADTQRLVVWQKSGEKAYFDLTDEPETTFEDGKLVIKTFKTTVSYPLTSVLRYTYEGGTITDVGEQTVRPDEMRYMQSEDKMAFDGLPDGTRLDVYSLDGIKLFTVQAHEGLRTIVSFTSYPAGTYVVKAGDATIKFLKR